MDFTELTALELGGMIKRRQLSAVEAAELMLKSIAASSKLNAYITVCGEYALDKARQVQKKLDSGELDSPLAGVPVALKDNICTRGIRTSCASKMLAEFVPPYSATLADRLEAAGAVIIGKLNMDEFAMGSTSETSYFGPVKNPWDTGRSPGGSSGGAAAAVAAGAAVLAVGSDTGGSIRQPASYCGVTGMKPTYGAISRYGLVAYASSLDQLGPVARDAIDCAALLEAVGGRDERDSTSLDTDFSRLTGRICGGVNGLRVGVLSDCFDGLDVDIERPITEAARELKRLGASVEATGFSLLKYAVPDYYILACAEASSNLSRFDGVKYGYRAEGCDSLRDMYLKTRTEGFGPEVRRRIMLGTFVLSSGYYDAYYKKAQQVRTLIGRAFDEAFSRFDLLLAPTAPCAAPKLGESLDDPLKMYLSDIYTVPANLAGLPAISLPCGFDENGLPVGFQLIGPPMGEEPLLTAAVAYQRSTDHHRKSPGEGKSL